MPIGLKSCGMDAASVEAVQRRSDAFMLVARGGWATNGVMKTDAGSTQLRDCCVGGLVHTCGWGKRVMITILIVILIVLLIASLPTWPYSSGWGYYPGGLLGTVLVIILILVVLGRL
jgi:Protein of unknown function (DUF3309)